MNHRARLSNLTPPPKNFQRDNGPSASRLSCQIRNDAIVDRERSFFLSSNRKKHQIKRLRISDCSLRRSILDTILASYLFLGKTHERWFSYYALLILWFTLLRNITQPSKNLNAKNRFRVIVSRFNSLWIFMRIHISINANKKMG